MISNEKTRCRVGKAKIRFFSLLCVTQDSCSGPFFRFSEKQLETTRKWRETAHKEEKQLENGSEPKVNVVEVKWKWNVRRRNGSEVEMEMEVTWMWNERRVTWKCNAVAWVDNGNTI